MKALPRAGELVAVPEMALRIGGCAANVAVDLAKQEVATSVMGKVGRDIWGRFLKEELSGHGIDTSGVMETDAFQTSQTLVLLCVGEDRRFVHSFGANKDLRAEDFNRERVASAKAFYLGGYLAMPGLEPGATADLFRFCRERGVTTFLDVVTSGDFEPSGELEAVLPFVDFFLPNDDEALLLTGRTDPAEQAQALIDLGCRTVVLTLGSRGTLVHDGTGLHRFGAFHVKAVDSSGSGDAFAAGFITAHLRGGTIEDWVRRGSALGASCVLKIGCTEGVFTRTQVEEFLASNRLSAA
jgi:sugar/nucleoside kinase (ribokinase family)